MERLIRFGDVLVEDNRLIEVDDSHEYACGGVKWHGKGVFIREYKLGVDIRKKFVQHTLKAGDVVYCTLFAHLGAFAVAEHDVDGALLSEKFPTFRLIDERLTLDYLKWFFRSGQLNRLAEEQATGMAAISLSHLSKKKFLNLKIPRPSLDRQAEVVRLSMHADDLVQKVAPAITNNARMAAHLLSANAERAFQGISTVKLSDIGDFVVRPADIQPAQRYAQITVAMQHRGLRLRRICEGRDIKSPGQSYVREGDLLFSRIDIRQGAIGFVSKELDGGVVTRDFPIFELSKKSELARKFLRYVFLSPSFMKQAQKASRGTTGRKKLKRERFLDFVIPWPTQSDQETLVSRLEKIEEKTIGLVRTYKAQQSLVANMSRSVVETLYGIDSGIVGSAATRSTSSIAA